MTIHILDCATMNPWFPRWHLGTPCLVIEADRGLILVDTGLGLHDFDHPSRLVRFFLADLGIENDPEMTAVRQLARRGFQPGDVKDIVQTHLHFDHAGGLPDFPHARVHVHRREYEAMLQPRGFMELAFNKPDFAHNPSWVLYDNLNAEWLGFEAIRLPLTPEMFLVPLFGHTRGHCGVAARDGAGWLFQCADAIPTNAEYQLLPNWFYRYTIGPHVPRLRTWAKLHPEVRILAGHMWKSFFAAQ